MDASLGSWWKVKDRHAPMPLAPGATLATSALELGRDADVSDGDW